MDQIIILQKRHDCLVVYQKNVMFKTMLNFIFQFFIRVPGIRALRFIILVVIFINYKFQIYISAQRHWKHKSKILNTTHIGLSFLLYKYDTFNVAPHKTDKWKKKKNPTPKYKSRHNYLILYVLHVLTRITAIRKNVRV